MRESHDYAPILAPPGPDNLDSGGVRPPLLRGRSDAVTCVDRAVCDGSVVAGRYAPYRPRPGCRPLRPVGSRLRRQYCCGCAVPRVRSEHRQAHHRRPHTFTTSCLDGNALSHLIAACIKDCRHDRTMLTVGRSAAGARSAGSPRGRDPAGRPTWAARRTDCSLCWRRDSTLRVRGVFPHGVRRE